MSFWELEADTGHKRGADVERKLAGIFPGMFPLAIAGGFSGNRGR
jgi:hypothetical protein